MVGGRLSIVAILKESVVLFATQYRGLKVITQIITNHWILSGFAVHATDCGIRYWRVGRNANMNALDIAKRYFPKADDEFLEFVIWEKTGFPSFWNIPKDGNTSEECFRKQLKAAVKLLR